MIRMGQTFHNENSDGRCLSRFQASKSETAPVSGAEEHGTAGPHFRVWRNGLICLTVTVVSGCVSSMYARYPVPWVNHPGSEAQAYQQQDPFPDPDIGPDAQGRPRDYARPRTESRKAAEQRLLFGLPGTPESMRPGSPQGGLKRPAAVY